MLLLHKRFIKLTLILLLAVFAYQFASKSALAATVTWDGGGTDGTCGGGAGDGNKWSCATNWSSDVVPSAGDSVVFDGTSTKDVNIDQSINVGSISVNLGYSGTLTQGSSNTINLSLASTYSFTQSDGIFSGSEASITLSNGGLYQSGGSFTSTSGNLFVAKNINLTGGTFSDHGGVITLNTTNNGSVSCNSNSFGQVEVDKGYNTNQVTFDNTCTINIVGTSPSSTGIIVNNGTINVTGNWSIAGGYTSNSGAVLTMTGDTLTISGTSGDLILNGGTFPASVTTITITDDFDNSANVLHDGIDITIGGTSATNFVCGSVNFNSVTIDRGYSTSDTVIDSSCNIDIAGINPSSTGYLINNGTINVTGNWSIAGGYTSNSGAVLTATGNTLTLTSVYGDLILSGGTFPSNITSVSLVDDFDDSANVLPGGTDLLINSGSDTTFTCGTTAYGDINVNKTDNRDFIVTNDCVMNDFLFSNGDFINPSSAVTYTILGDLSLVDENNDEVGGDNFNIEMSGSNLQNISNLITFNGDIAINKTAEQAQLITDFSASNLSTCSLDGGTLYLNGFNMNCPGGNTLASNSVLKIMGGEAFGSNPTIASGNLIEIIGDGDSSEDIYGLPNWNYKNLTINFTDSADVINTDSFASSLIGYWKMEEGNGSIVADSSNNSNDAQVSVDAAFSATVPTIQETNNYSIAISGQNTSYLDPGDSLNLAQNKSQIGASAWINLNSIPTSTSATIFGLSTGNSNSNTRFGFEVYDNEIRCGGRSSDSDSYIYSMTSAVNLVTGNWYHITCNIDYENNTIQIYVNGAERDSTKYGNFSSSATANTVSLKSAIGVDEDKSGYNFNGKIDELRLYDRLLTKGEISFLSNGYVSSHLDTLTVSEDFTISNGTMHGPSSSFTVGGNWTNNSAFTANGGTVILNGLSQLLTGSTTFYNLTKANTGSADTLTFTAGSTQTIANDLTLTGESNAVLSLRSSSENTQWSIDPQGNRTISYLDVQDSNNTNVTAISTAGLNITNSGNNTNWEFDSSPPNLNITPISPDPGTDTTPSLTGTATESVGTVSSVEYQMDGTAGSWSSCVADDASFDEASEAFTCTVSPALSDGSHTIYVRATDNNTNTTTDGAAATDTFVVDTTAPSVPGTPSAISASDDLTPTWNFAESTDATTALATTDAYTLQWSTDSNFVSGVSSTTLQTTDCSAGTCSFTHSTDLTNATWYFRAKAKDVLDNESAYSSAGSITIATDSNPPTGSITINIGDTTNPTYTRSTAATLTISATDDVSSAANMQMMVADSSDFSGASWESYATSKSWTLNSGDGTKTVYVKFKDELDNTSAAYSDSITLDTTKPTDAELVSPADNAATNNVTPSFSFKKVTDELGDITKYKLIVDDSTFIDDIDPNDPGGNHIRENDDRYIYYNENEIQVYSKTELTETKHRWRIDAYDSIGNISQSDTRTLTVDRSLPTISVATIGGRSVNVSGTSQEYMPVVVSTAQPKFIGGAEANAKIEITDIETVKILCETTSDENGSWSCRPDLAVSYGLHKIVVKATDAAGNSSQLPTIALTVGNGQLQLTVEKQKITATPQPSPTSSAKKTDENQTKEKEVPADKTYKVSIHILDKDGNPLPFVTVHLFSEPKTTITDENGYANFDDVPKGDHTLVVESDDYVGEQQITLDGDTAKHELTVSVQKKMSLREMILIIMTGALVISTITFIILYLKEKRKNLASTI